MEYKKFGDQIIKRKDHTEEWVVVPEEELFEARVAIGVEEVRRAEIVAKGPGRVTARIIRGGGQ